MGRKPLGEKKLTNAEKQKQYRNRKNPEERKRADKKRKSNERCAIYADKQKYKEYLRKKNKAQKANRARKAEQREEATIIKFNFPVISRSIKRVKKSLPRNSAVRKIVVNSLFEEQIDCSPRKRRLISTWTNVKKPAQSGRPSILTEALREKLDDYLSQNSISFTLPGRNNQVYIGKDGNGESMFESKKYILWTLAELAAIIEHEDDEELSDLKFSTIYRYIKAKKQYIINSKIPEVDCLCPLCESVELMCEGVNKSCEMNNLPKKCHELLEKIGCKTLTEDCANSTCENCPTLDLEFLTDVERIPYYHWVKKQHYEKELTELSGTEMKEKLTEMFVKIKTHFYQKREQSKMYKKHIAELADNEMLIHVDYSENYKNKQQNEIKSAFYGQGQFTLFTACVYVKLDDKVVCKSFALVTLENDHSCNVSFALNNFLINECSKYKSCSVIKFWSDGCASQFRSKFAFYMLTKFNADLHIQWHFFEANHGKGAVDGIGGRVKHSVFRRVLSKKVIIQNPKHFAEFANSILPKIQVPFVDDDQLELGFNDECRKNSTYIPGTLKVHFVNRIVTGSTCILKFYKTTTSVEEMRNKSYEIGSVPQATRTRTERAEKEKQEKLEKESKKKEKERTKEDKIKAFEKCQEECNCERSKCAASGLKRCSVCKSFLKSQCKKKQCSVDGKQPEMLLPKCDVRKLKVAEVFSDSDNDSDEVDSDNNSDDADEDNNSDEVDSDNNSDDADEDNNSDEADSDNNSDDADEDNNSDDNSDDTDEDLLMGSNENEIEESDKDEMEQADKTKQAGEPEPVLQIGDCVKLLTDPFQGFYAIVSNSDGYGDEIEIRYFRKSCGYHVVSDRLGELDSRLPSEMKKVNFTMDKRDHYFFNE